MEDGEKAEKQVSSRITSRLGIPVGRGGSSRTCLWLQHVGHRHSAVHSHARQVAIRQGLQQRSWVKEEPLAAWEAGGL